VQRSTAAVPALLAVLVLLLAGCGGDDDDGGDAAATTPATEQASGGNERLDEDSWLEYEELRDNARTVNDAAVETFRTCRDLTLTTVPQDQVEECLGDSAGKVVDEGRKVLAELDGFAGEVSGACSDALVDLQGNIKQYSSSVLAIQNSVDQSRIPTTDDIDAALSTLTASRAAATKFEAACKPV
jgi:hypothetical protein